MAMFQRQDKGQFCANQSCVEISAPGDESAFLLGVLFDQLARSDAFGQ